MCIRALSLSGDVANPPRKRLPSVMSVGVRRGGSASSSSLTGGSLLMERNPLAPPTRGTGGRPGAGGPSPARLARRTEAQLGWASFAAVTAIMLIVVLLWIVESRPGWLYAFVVSIGMGFSGYSLIELFGEQVRSFVTDIFDKARSTIGRKGDDT